MEREVSGVLDWPGEERTIGCEFVGCVKLFREITILNELIGGRVQKTWLVPPILSKSSSDNVMPSSKLITVSSY